jgi:hypothetical protein
VHASRVPLGHCEGCDRARHVLGTQRRAFERIDGDVHLGAGLANLSPMNSIGASSISPSPITTVPSIGSLLSSRRMASTAALSAALCAASAQSGGGDRCALGHAHDLNRQNALQHLVRLDGNG